MARLAARKKVIFPAKRPPLADKKKSNPKIPPTPSIPIIYKYNDIYNQTCFFFSSVGLATTFWDIKETHFFLFLLLVMMIYTALALLFLDFWGFD